MANPIPNSLALTTVNDGAQIIASDHRNNYSAIQSAVNLIRAALAGGTAGQFLQAVDGADVQWATIQKYRKTTPKVVANTVTETDLLNGEITVGANVLGTNNTLRFTAWGDQINNTGSTQSTPRWKLKLGATTIIDSNVLAASWAANSARFGWRLVVEIDALGATNSQWTWFDLNLTGVVASSSSGTPTTGEGAMFGHLVGAAIGYWRAAIGNASAIDTTASQLLAFTVTLPAANALLDVTLKGALVEVV